jgi:aspartyl-tRNA(Asn)/glutamyl-tRNA(Gln) amidotransferase subunit A
MLKTFQDIQKALSEGKSVVDITRHYFTQIEAKKDLNAFLEVFEESALAKAKDVDDKLAKGQAGRLAGMVIGLKDNICYKGHKVSASSKILEGFTSLYSATVVERLLAEDAVIIGRLNCDEFAMGSSNENSAYGPVLNPINKSLVPGGSSGGSAAAVAAGLCTMALGSDTGGSIRQPASFTGTYGMKPSYGRLSRYGLIAYSSSFDQIGPFSNSLEDNALVYEIMAGTDDFDSTTSSRPVETCLPVDGEKKYKVGVIRDYMNHKGMSAEVKKHLLNTVEKLKAAGHSIVELDFPYLNQMVPTYYVLTTAEASSNLSRFDGVHYGHQSKVANGVEETYKKSRSEGFGPEVKRRIMAGTFVLSHGYYDAYYTKGQRVRRVLQNETDAFFKQVDVVLTPTTPDVAFELNGVSDPIQMYLQDIFTVHANLSGNPAISLPLGQNTEGLPFGVQVMAPRFNEKIMFDFSKTLEQL